MTNRSLTEMKSSLLNPLFLVYCVLAIMLLIAQVISPGFVSFQNINNILVRSSFLGMIAIGQTIVILIGGIDLSVASVVTLSNLVAAEILSGSDANIPAALVISVAIGLTAGIVNGVCIYYLKIPPMIMTLAAGNVLWGIGLIYSKGAPKGYAAPLLQFLITGRLFDIVPYMAILWGILAIAAIFLLRGTVFGRSVYAVGTNVQTARYSGINVTRITIACYAISGAISGLVGMLYVGYTNTSFLDVGNIFMMSSVAAVVVGGTSAAGGEGGYAGTIAGALIMTVLTAILTVINIQESGRRVMEGIIILLMVFVYSRRKSSL